MKEKNKSRFLSKDEALMAITATLGADSMPSLCRALKFKLYCKEVLLERPANRDTYIINAIYEVTARDLRQVDDNVFTAILKTVGPPYSNEHKTCYERIAELESGKEKPRYDDLLTEVKEFRLA